MNTININEVQDIVKSIDTANLLISANSIAFSYERDTIDENDIYNLLRDVVSTVTTIEILKSAIKV